MHYIISDDSVFYFIIIVHNITLFFIYNTIDFATDLDYIGDSFESGEIEWHEKPMQKERSENTTRDGNKQKYYCNHRFL